MCIRDRSKAAIAELVKKGITDATVTGAGLSSDDASKYTFAEKDVYKRQEYIGVDACAVNLMRPAMYGAYHHITVLGKENEPCDHKYDVTGSLCENNDKFAIDRDVYKRQE